jgi:hypothetical protein
MAAVRPRSAPPAEAARRPSGGVWPWIAVLVALGFFAQVSLSGLRPALQERQRLEREEQRLLQRREALDARTRELTERLAAQRDPVYIERERRALLDPERRED